MSTRHARATSVADGGTPGGILLDAGTNELEVLVFRMGEGRFGVNVAKVREVIRGEKPSEAPKMHSSVLGVINKRGDLVPLVDLAKHLGIGSVDTANIAEARIIITEFNGTVVGFVVQDVERIHRLGWDRVESVPDLGSVEGIATGGGAGAGTAQAAAMTVESGGVRYSTCTGIIKFDEYLLLMVDFESITDSIRMHDRLHVGAVPNEAGVDRSSVRVVMAEDSAFIREMLTTTFRASGYTGVTVYQNGAEAWRALDEMAARGEAPDVVISDIEMPGIDGLHLTKLIKDDARLAGVPVILFSSLINDENRKKGRQVGADLQIPKPDLAEIVLMVDRFVQSGLEGMLAAA